MTIKEYSMSRGVSYEAVRKQVSALKKKELKKHIKYNGRTAELDDYAVEILDQHRQQREVVVVASNIDTQKELERLHDQVHQLQAELLKRADKITELIEKNSLLLEEKTKLIEDKTRREVLEKDNEELKQELNKYQRTIFGLYKKVD